MAARDEPGLVARGQAGDRQAQEELVRRCQEQVFRLCYSLLGDREEALDAAQDALVAMLRSLPRFRGEASWRTWLYRLTTNVCLSRQRQARVRARWQGRLPEDHPDPAAPPDTLVLERLAHHELLRQLVALPPAFRTVLVLRELEGLAYDEIAQMLGLPLGTVQSRISRARHMLRQALVSRGLVGGEAKGAVR